MNADAGVRSSQDHFLRVSSRRGCCCPLHMILQQPETNVPDRSQDTGPRAPAGCPASHPSVMPPPVEGGLPGSGLLPDPPSGTLCPLSAYPHLDRSCDPEPDDSRILQEKDVIHLTKEIFSIGLGPVLHLPGALSITDDQHHNPGSGIRFVR